MKTLFVAAVAALVALLAAGATVLVLVLRDGIGARREPSRVETAIARRLRHLAIPAGARDAQNPVPRSEAAVTEGRAHFADHCASCHANDGSGDTKIGRSLYPRAPDMRRPSTQELTDGELFHIIENGVRLTGMPAWGGEGHEEESWKLVHFIRHLPDLTPEELLEMEKLNPRSADAWRELAEEEAFLRGEEPASAAPPAHRHDHPHRH